jgi:hypothetical protein
MARRRLEAFAADDYLRALQSVLGEEVPQKHLDMLREHFNAPNHTTTWKQLADKVGYPNFNSVSLQYGKFAERVARALGLREKPLDPGGYGWWLWALVHWADERDAESGHTAFVLRPEVVEALERMGYGQDPELRDEPSTELPERVWRAITERRGQPTFREQLLRAYGGRCAVTGCDAEAALEAAHIRGYAETGEQDVTNGLLLRADIHTLFDLGLVRIDPETLRVALAPELRGTCYGELQGRELRLPERQADGPSRDALRKRWEGGR